MEYYEQVIEVLVTPLGRVQIVLVHYLSETGTLLRVQQEIRFP